MIEAILKPFFFLVEEMTKRIDTLERSLKQMEESPNTANDTTNNSEEQ